MVYKAHGIGDQTAQVQTLTLLASSLGQATESLWLQVSTHPCEMWKENEIKYVTCLVHHFLLPMEMVSFPTNLYPFYCLITASAWPKATGYSAKIAGPSRAEPREAKAKSDLGELHISHLLSCIRLPFLSPAWLQHSRLPITASVLCPSSLAHTSILLLIKDVGMFICPMIGVLILFRIT